MGKAHPGTSPYMEISSLNAYTQILQPCNSLGTILQLGLQPLNKQRKTLKFIEICCWFIYDFVSNIASTRNQGKAHPGTSPYMEISSLNAYTQILQPCNSLGTILQLGLQPLNKQRKTLKFIEICCWFIYDFVSNIASTRNQNHKENEHKNAEAMKKSQWPPC